MEKAIDSFIDYLHQEKKTSKNTEMSYKRDLKKVQAFMAGQGVFDVQKTDGDNTGKQLW